MELDEGAKQLLDGAKRSYLRADYPRARPQLERFLQVEPNYADVHNMLGVIYHAAGELSRALAALERALEINPRYTEAAINLAVLYNDMGRYDDARRIYSRALKDSHAHPSGLDPYVAGKIANMHAEIAEAYRSAGQVDKAIGEFGRALELCADFADIRTQMAALLIQQKAFDRAQQELQRAIAHRPHYAAARVQLGVCQLAMGERAAAVATWREVLDKDPNNRAAAMYLRAAPP